MWKRIKEILTSKKVRTFLEHLAEWIIGAAIGAVISYFFDKPIVTCAVLVLSAFLAILYLFVTLKFQIQLDLFKIMQTELDSGNYIQVIRLGYPLSRPLHLSGRIKLRYNIGSIVKSACEGLERTNVSQIDINGKKLFVNEIKATVLIDDLGWTAFSLHKTQVAIDNIKKGVEIAENAQWQLLVLKGYRHLIGIFDELQDTTQCEDATRKGYDILNSDIFKNSFSSIADYNHVVAEFEYAVAKTLMYSNPNDALTKAQHAQSVFSNGSPDNDRYAKTFDLIGDIYAGFNDPQKLKLAQETYKIGIQKCIEFGRSERLLRIAIDYISLLIKMLQSTRSIYDKASWDSIDEEEKRIFNSAISCSSNIDNHDFEQQLKNAHKKYIKSRNQYNKRR